MHSVGVIQKSSKLKTLAHLNKKLENSFAILEQNHFTFFDILTSEADEHTIA